MMENSNVNSRTTDEYLFVETTERINRDIKERGGLGKVEDILIGRRLSGLCSALKAITDSVITEIEPVRRSLCLKIRVEPPIPSQFGADVQEATRSYLETEYEERYSH